MRENKQCASSLPLTFFFFLVLTGKDVQKLWAVKTERRFILSKIVNKPEEKWGDASRGKRHHSKNAHVLYHIRAVEPGRRELESFAKAFLLTNCFEVLKERKCFAESLYCSNVLNLFCGCQDNRVVPARWERKNVLHLELTRTRHSYVPQK